MGKRLANINVENTEENRRKYRYATDKTFYTLHDVRLVASRIGLIVFT